MTAALPLPDAAAPLAPGRAAPVAPRAPLRVALAGCGVVGGAFARLVAAERAALVARAGMRVEIVRVLVRDATRPRDVPVPADRFTSDVDAFLQTVATGADVVVEALGGLEPAGRVAAGALAAGRHLVTANKTLLADRGPALVALAARAGGALDFEAAVAGAVPAVRVLRDGVAGVGVRAVRGILNGTCNWLLGRLAAGEPWDAALAEARRLGFAEPDPTMDVTGADAEAKLRVLAWLAFGVEPGALRVATRGLVPDAERLVAAARAAGRSCRLVAEVVETPAGVVATVEPVAVPADGEFGRVHGERNAVVVESESAGTIVLGGPGAGGAPTAGALLGDVLRAHRAGDAPAGPPAGALGSVHAGLPATRVAPADDRALAWLVALPVALAAEGAGGGDGLAGAARRVGVALAPEPAVPGAALALWRVTAPRAAADALARQAARLALPLTVLRLEG